MEEAVLLDTDVFSYLLRRGDKRAELYKAHVVGKTIAVSFVTVGELYFGIQKKKWGGKHTRGQPGRPRPPA